MSFTSTDADQREKKQLRWLFVFVFLWLWPNWPDMRSSPVERYGIQSYCSFFCDNRLQLPPPLHFTSCTTLCVSLWSELFHCVIQNSSTSIFGAQRDHTKHKFWAAFFRFASNNHNLPLFDAFSQALRLLLRLSQLVDKLLAPLQRQRVGLEISRRGLRKNMKR